jgi:carboxyl-terminal processing protease
MNDAARRALFDRVWTHVADNYYESSYHGTDWRAVGRRYASQLDSIGNDDALHALLAGMVGELRDAHSRYFPPADAAALRGRVSRGIGATVSEVDGIAVIETVADNSPAKRAGLEPGMRVTAVNGELIEDRYARLLQSEPAASTVRATRALTWRKTIFGREDLVSLTVEQDGLDRDVYARRQSISASPAVTATMLADSVLYLRFDAFRTSIASQLRDSLEAYPNARGVVLDLRNNGGGDAAETIRAAGLFLPRRVSAGEFFSRVARVNLGFVRIRDGSRPTTGGARDADRRPLAILTGVLTGSGGELLAALLQEEQRATIVGDTTCGCLTAVTRRVPMPGGGMLMISNRGYKTRRGTIIEGRGVAPDVVVRKTRADLVARKDGVLDAARSVLANRLRMSTATP